MASLKNCIAKMGKNLGADVEDIYDRADELGDPVAGVQDLLDELLYSRDQMLEAFRAELPGKPEFAMQGSLLANRVIDHVGSRLDKFRFYAQDKMIDVRRAQEAVGGVAEQEDAYMAEAIWQGRAGERIQLFEEQRVDPILQILASSGITLEAAGQFFVARHAQEANRYLESINPNTPNNKALSGMSNSAAASILATHQNDPIFQQLGQLFDQMNQERVALLVREGLITQADAAAWQNQYQHYAPLYREEAEESLLPPRGAGFNIKGKESKRRVGSNRAVDYENVLTHAIAQTESSIIRAEKNKVGKALLQFAAKNPDPNFWTIDKPKVMRTVGKDNTVVTTTDPRDHDNELSVKIAGKVHRITFNESNPEAMRMVRAMKNLDNASNEFLMKYVGGVMRVLAGLYTSWSPEFVISNVARDLQTAGYNLTSTELEDVKLKVLTRVPMAVAGLKQNIRNRDMTGNLTGEWSQWAERFKLAGAKTGWIESYSNITDRQAALARKMKKFEDGGGMRAGFDAVVKYVEDYNTIAENGVRLAAFRTAIEDLGMSEKAAAALAKDLTVNFNRKGMYGPLANISWLFYNASLQGNVRMVQTMLRSKQGRQLAALTIGFATVLDIINRMNADDDDDGENLYDALPDHVKAHNFIIMGRKEPIFKFPLPWGYNNLHVIGQQIGEATTGDRFDPFTSTMRIAVALADSFNPLGAGSLAQMISPTLTDPIVQIAENKNWGGQPLMPRQTGFGPEKPNSELYWSSSREASKAIATWLNEVGGGDAVRPTEYELLNISPEWIDVFIDMFTGSAGRVVADTFNLAHKAVTSQDIALNEIPMARKLTGYDSSRGIQMRYYERSKDVQYLDLQLEKAEGERRAALKALPQAGLIAYEKTISKQVQGLRGDIRAYKADDSLSDERRQEKIQRAENKMRRAMSAFNRAYAEDVLGQPKEKPKGKAA